MRNLHQHEVATISGGSTHIAQVGCALVGTLLGYFHGLIRGNMPASLVVGTAMGVGYGAAFNYAYDQDKNRGEHSIAEAVK